MQHVCTPLPRQPGLTAGAGTHQVWDPARPRADAALNTESNLPAEKNVRVHIDRVLGQRCPRRQPPPHAYGSADLRALHTQLTSNGFLQIATLERKFTRNPLYLVRQSAHRVSADELAHRPTVSSSSPPRCLLLGHSTAQQDRRVGPLGKAGPTPVS